MHRVRVGLIGLAWVFLLVMLATTFLHVAGADRSAAFAKLEAWTGVRPTVPQIALTTAPREPRVPPAMLRALRR